jgi:hypothetical protein
MYLPEPTRHVAVRIDGGASNVRFIRPNGVPARLQIGGGASRLEFDRELFGAIDGRIRLQSAGFEEASGRYDVVVGGGASRLTVRWRKAAGSTDRRQAHEDIPGDERA